MVALRAPRRYFRDSATALAAALCGLALASCTTPATYTPTLSYEAQQRQTLQAEIDALAFRMASAPTQAERDAASQEHMRLLVLYLASVYREQDAAKAARAARIAAAAATADDESGDGETVYSPGQCIGAVVMGRCHGSIMPDGDHHPTCHGQMLNGQCTGPMF